MYGLDLTDKALALAGEWQDAGREMTAETLRALVAEVRAGRDMAKDAERYRWLRAQNWNDGRLAVVADPKDAVKLGHDCPSLARLDERIDEAMLVRRLGESTMIGEYEY